MNKLFWTLIACLQFTFSFSQTSNLKSQPEYNSPAVLARQLTKGLASDSLKVNAFFDWITGHVEYDVSVFTGKAVTPESQKASRVLQSQKAVCQGYANLFYELCRTANIPVEIIEGYCRYSPQKPEELQLHAWNAVKVNEKWYVMDLTWGTGYLDMNQGGKYVREQNRKFYLASPDQLASTHLPFDPLWQLSAYPRTKEEFLANAAASANNKFSFTDTLSVFEKQDSLTRRVQAYRRMHQFDPGNEEPKVRLSYHYNHLAIAIMDQYTKVRRTLKTKEQLAQQKNKLNQLLNQAEAYYSSSLKFTDGISSKSFYFASVTDNRRIINQNLALIKDERNFIQKYTLN